MKKIIFLLFFIVSVIFISCSNSANSGNSEGENKENEENNLSQFPAEKIEWFYSFKINNIQCYSKNDYIIYVNDVNYNNFLQIPDLYEFPAKYKLDKSNFNTINEYKEKIFEIFNITNSMVISDIAINFYYADQFYEKYEIGNNNINSCITKNVPDFYINNKAGTNSINEIKSKIKLFIKFGNINNSSYINDNSLNFIEKEFNISRFIPMNIWSDLNYYNTVNQFVYDIEFIYKINNNRNIKEFIIDTKKFEDLFKIFNDSLFNNSNVSIQ